MPINPKLKEIIDNRTDMTAEYKASLLAVMENATPDFQNGWIAQQDYTRQVNAFKAEQQEWKTKADKFYNESNAVIDGWKSEVTKANSAVAAAQARIAELEAGAGGTNGLPRTPTQDDAALKEISQLKTLIAGLESKLPQNVITADVLETKLNGAYQSAVGFIGEQVLTLSELAAKHQATFGERFDKAKQEQLITYANEQSTKLGHRISLDQAYDMQYAEQSRKKWETDKEKEITERVTSTLRVPGAAGSPAAGTSELGPLQIRMRELDNQAAGKTDGAGYRSWQEAAAAGADELVKEGKY
jgi:hypothetical protein